MAQQAGKLWPCALCGREAVTEQMIYSSHTHRRFCRDTRACDRRRAKLKRQKEA